MSADTSSTIDHIDADDTVAVDLPQPADDCIDIGLGNGVGQTGAAFAPCTLPTTVVVEVGVPPTLPATGGGDAIHPFTCVVLVAAGVVLLVAGRRPRRGKRLRRRQRNAVARLREQPVVR